MEIRELGRQAARAPRSAWLLFLGVSLLLTAAVRAVGAVRSQGEVVDAVLRDHALTSLWSYSQLLEPPLLDLLEHIFHAATHVDGSRHLSPQEVRSSVPLPELVLSAHSLHDCGEAHGPLRYAVRFFARDPAAAQAGALLADRDVELLRNATIAHARRTRPPRRTEHVFGWRMDSTAFLAAYSEQFVPGDTVYYVVLLDSAAVNPVFQYPISNRMVPPTLMRDGVAGDVMSVFASVDGASLFGSAHQSRIAQEARLPFLEGVVVRVGLRDEAAALARTPGLPVSPVPLLLAAILISLGLVLLGVRQVQREAKLASMRADFVSSVSHELRTPLALQRIFLDTLRMGRARTDDDERWSLENIDRENMRLTHLVDNIMQFSRIERGSASLNASRHGLASAAGATVDRFRRLAAVRSVAIELRVEADSQVELDAEAFAQVLGNVLENAVKYGSEGQAVAVTVDRNGTHARVLVDDQGPGVPERDRLRVFQPFWRGGREDNAAGGSGIGLAVVHELMTLHGGRACCDAAPMGGARFILEFPLTTEA